MVAYASEDWDDYRGLWLYRLADSVRTRLTPDGTFVFSPAFSPDGLNLAYSRRNGATREIVIHDIQAGTDTVVYSTSAWPGSLRDSERNNRPKIAFRFR